MRTVAGSSEKGNRADRLVEYDFSRPIRITAMRSGGLDTLFYSFLLSLCLTAMILLLSLRGGKMHFEFTFWRTLLCLPFSVVAVILYQMLNEIRRYPPKLVKQNVWTIDELMALTGKDRQETERIITRVLEACFVVDASCIVGSEPDTASVQGGAEAVSAESENDVLLPSDAEKDKTVHSFSKYDS